MDSRGKAFQTEETVLARFLCQREKKKNVIYSKKGEKATGTK